MDKANVFRFNCKVYDTVGCLSYKFNSRSNVCLLKRKYKRKQVIASGVGLRFKFQD